MRPCRPHLGRLEGAKLSSAPFGQGSLASNQVCHLTCLSVCPGTGRGRDTLTGGEEDSCARTVTRPSLAQCRALSVDWPGPRSPHRLYLTVQVSVDYQMRGEGECGQGAGSSGLQQLGQVGRRAGDLPGTCWLAVTAESLRESNRFHLSLSQGRSLRR